MKQKAARSHNRTDTGGRRKERLALQTLICALHKPVCFARFGPRKVSCHCAKAHQKF